MSRIYKIKVILILNIVESDVYILELKHTHGYIISLCGLFITLLVHLGEVMWSSCLYKSGYHYYLFWDVGY